MSSSMGEVEYFPCKHQFKEGKGDGCHDFDPSDGDPLICECCGCHRNYHLVLFNEESRYGACEKPIAEQGGHDGCQAFIPSMPKEKYCACCSHHRNFHKPLISQKSMPSTNCPSGNNMRPDSSSEPSVSGSSTPSLGGHHPPTHGISKDLLDEAKHGNVDDVSYGIHDLDMTKYDVFVNHRGPDAKLSFVAHLEEEFKRHGLTAWVDRNALVKGEPNWNSIKTAIKKIRVHVAIFSPGYTESVWCLNELLAMIECQQEPRTAVLLPIFYNVQPEHLRRPDLFEQFRRGLQKHKGRGLCVENWEAALREAADLSGISLQTMAGDENKLKKKIIEEVERILRHHSFRMQATPKHKVGLQTLLNTELEELAKMGDGIAIRGISGMGGLGKTTLAKEVYNHYSQENTFECQTFLELGKGADMVTLQRQALYDLLQKKDRVENVSENYNFWFSRLIGRSVLIVIDDILNDDQFMQLVPDLTRLGPKSRIILTSREQNVLRLIMSDIPKPSLHIMRPLKPEDSFELFTFHAFKGTKPPSKASNLKMYDLATRITCSCDGLPMALEIIGKHMFGKKEDVWIRTAETLQSRPEVLSKLSISFEGLPSEGEKTMFLDIACQMIGLHVADAIDIWESCAPSCTYLCSMSRNVPDSLAILKDKSLIDVDTNNLLTMHDLLREMGKELVCQEKIGGKTLPFGDRSHLWDLHAQNSLLEKGKDVEEKIRGMSLVGTEVHMATIDASMFKKFVELHLLQLDGTRIEGDFSGTSNKLRWLQWRSSFLKCVPTKMCFSYLTMLDLSKSNSLTRLWSEDQVPKLLRVLLLRDCVLLEKIPHDIRLLEYLRKLDLQGCKNLNELPQSLGQVTQLEYLNLNECGNLNNLPDEMVNLSSLKIFSMNRCSKITKLPENFGNLKALLEFSAEGAIGLSALPDSFSGLHNLEKIVLNDSHHLTTLPKSIKGLVKLKELRMPSTGISTLPDDFGDLENLVELFLQHCECFESLPESFGKLKSLRMLRLHKCYRFRRLPQNFQELFNLVDLDLEECPIEDGDLPQNLGGLKRLEFLRMRKTNVTSLPECFRDLVALVHLDMQESPNLVDVRALPASLEELLLSHCPKLMETVNMEKNKSLIKLDLHGCTSLTAVQGLEHLDSLQEINVSGCRKLVDMHEKLLHKTKMMRCFLTGSGACQEYNNNFLEGKQISSQLVSYYDHTLRFAQNIMPKKISSKEHANELSMEATVSSRKKVKAIVIAVVAHDQGWSDYPHLHGMYNADCEIEVRIIRGDEEVYSSRVIRLRHADHRDQVYLLTLYESHPITRRLQLDDKVCAFALSRYQGWRITVMQGNISFVHDEQDHPGLAYRNLRLKDYQPGTHEYPKVIQAYSIGAVLQFTADGVGDGSSSVHRTPGRLVYKPDPDPNGDGTSLDSKFVGALKNEEPLVDSGPNWGYLMQPDESTSNFIWSETFNFP